MEYEEETGYEEETVRAKLIISGFDCTPEEITKILGISPHKTWLCGEKTTPKSIICYKSNDWLFSTPLFSIQESGLEKQIDLLMSTIKLAVESFKNLPENVSVTVSCPFYVNNPKSLALGVSTEAIQTMAKINAYLDIDLM